MSELFLVWKSPKPLLSSPLTSVLPDWQVDSWFWYPCGLLNYSWYLYCDTYLFLLARRGCYSHLLEPVLKSLAVHGSSAVVYFRCSGGGAAWRITVCRFRCCCRRNAKLLWAPLCHTAVIRVMWQRRWTSVIRPCFPLGMSLVSDAE